MSPCLGSGAHQAPGVAEQSMDNASLEEEQDAYWAGLPQSHQGQASCCLRTYRLLTGLHLPERPLGCHHLHPHVLQDPRALRGRALSSVVLTCCSKVGSRWKRWGPGSFPSLPPSPAPLLMSLLSVHQASRSCSLRAALPWCLLAMD